MGQAERFWRWCKRNPVVSGLAGAVAASLFIGILVSTYFAVQASRRALAESRERTRALKAEKNMEGLLARGLARTLDPDGDGKETLSIPEAEALWELARLGDTDIGLRFLDEATRDPITVSQLGARSEPALIAAVGLDAEKRKRVARLLSERLGDPGLQLQSKVDLAFVALEFEDPGTPETEEECGFLIQGLSGNFPDQHMTWRKRLIAVSARIDPSIAAKTLARALGRETNSDALSSLASALSGVASRMDPTEAGPICARPPRHSPKHWAVRRMPMPARPWRGICRLWRGGWTRPRPHASAARPPRCSPKRSAVRRMPMPACPWHRRCRRWRAGWTRAQAAKILAEALGRETDARARSSLASALSEVAGRMDPTEAARVCGQAAKTLAEALGHETDAGARSSLASALSTVAGRMDPTEAARICGQAAKTLAEALGRETDARARSSLASALSAVAGRLDPAEAARLCGQAAKVLAEALGRETDASARSSLATALSEVSGRMDPVDASRILSQALARETDAGAQASLAAGLAAVGARMEPSNATQVAQTLSETMEKEKDAKVQGDLAWSLGPLADRLGTDEAARICQPGAERLSKALKETRNLDERGFSLVKGLGAMLIRLPQDQAVQAIHLLATVAEETRGGMQSRTVDFYDLIDSLDPGDATRVARLLAAAVEKEKDPNVRWWLAAGLCRAAEKMDLEEIAHVCGSVAKDMANAVATKKASGGLEYSGYLFHGFMVVASRMGSAHTGEVAKVLAARLEQEPEANARSRLAQALAAVAGRMEPAQTAQVCGQAAKPAGRQSGAGDGCQCPQQIGIRPSRQWRAGWSPAAAGRQGTRRSTGP